MRLRLARAVSTWPRLRRGDASWRSRRNWTHERRFGTFKTRLMRVARRGGEQMVEAAGVVAEHVALPHAHPATRHGKDAAGCERLDRSIGSLFAARDAQIGAAGAQRVEDGVGAALELAP